MDRNPRTLGLYLHGGPGFSADIERRWFGDSIAIDWWDQPPAAESDPDAFSSLAEVAATRLRELAERTQRPVPLVSHSVGAVLAAQLASDEPRLIESITLINPTFDLLHSLCNLAERLLDAGLAPSAVDTALRRSRDHDASFVDLAIALTGIPQLLDHYWSPSSTAARVRFYSLAPNGPPLNFDTFTRVGRAIQERARDATAKTCRAPVRAILGEHDPLRGPDDVVAVRRRFPDADVLVADAGHMAIFELPEAVWLPPALEAEAALPV